MELMEASARTRVAGVDGERDGDNGRRSGRVLCSLSTDHPSMHKAHRDEEDDEAMMLDNLAGI